MPKNRYECSKCGKELQENARPCPDCGCNSRRVFVFIEDKITTRTSIKGKVKGNNGKIKRKFYSREKISKTGKEAREQLDIDIEGNRKFHHVEERDENGKYKVVHHEDEPLKKKK